MVGVLESCDISSLCGLPGMMAPFGSVVGKAAAYGDVTLRTADEMAVRVKRHSLTQWAVRFMGIPHMGLRMRARALLRQMAVALPKANGRLLDLGCGVGVYSLELADRSRQPVIGVDLSFEKVRMAKQMAADLRLPCRFVVADGTRLPFTAETFDAVLCTEVIEHIPQDVEAVKEMHRVTRSGGRLFLSTTGISDITKDFESDMGHARIGYSAQQLASILREAGFALLSFAPYGLTFGAYAWRINRIAMRSAMLLGVSFYPLFVLAWFDELIPRDKLDTRASIGWIVAARK